MSEMSHHEHFMNKAIQLGESGRGRTGANPSVGCVLVKENKIVGLGRTQDGGRPHAEAVALEMAGTAAIGATAYVTLEPCSHIGRSGPCSDALVESGVARVFVGIADPDHRVNGAGVERLRAAGIEVLVGLQSDAVRQSLRGYLMRKEHGRPYITLKLAMTIDGKIATHTGESKWITDSTARHFAHMRRAAVDGVMVGAGTVRNDDPQLTARGLEDVVQPRRIVVSRRLDLGDADGLKRRLDVAPVTLIHGPNVDASTVRVWTDLGADLFEVDEVDDQLNLQAAMLHLGDIGINEIFCEGGAFLAASLVQNDLVDELMTIYAGKIIGGDGLSGVNPIGVDLLKTAPTFKISSSEMLGDDFCIFWTRKNSAGWSQDDQETLIGN